MAFHDCIGNKSFVALNATRIKLGKLMKKDVKDRESKKPNRIETERNEMNS